MTRSACVLRLATALWAVASLTACAPEEEDVLDPTSDENAPLAQIEERTPVYISVLNPPGSGGKKVLDVRGYSKADRAEVQIFELRRNEYPYGSNQYWYVDWVERDVVMLRNAGSDKCLDKSRDVPNADGNKVYQYPCRNTDNQKWRVERRDSGDWVRLRNVQDGSRCLDVSGARFADEARLHVWTCHDGWNQRFNIY